MKLEIYPEVRALIFDLDGTLCDSLPVHLTAWQAVCKRLNCTFDENILVEMTGMATISFAERIKSDHQLEIDAKEIVKMKQLEFWGIIHRVKPHHPVVDLMRNAHGNIPMAVGTGAGRTSAMLQMKELGIDHFFDAIVTADDVLNHKPEPDTFLKCAELMNIDPGSCQVFEDGDLGIQAAQTAGMLVTDVRPFVRNPFE